MLLLISLCLTTDICVYAYVLCVNVCRLRVLMDVTVSTLILRLISLLSIGKSRNTLSVQLYSWYIQLSCLSSHRSA
jgi:hypothetical protein